MRIFLYLFAMMIAFNVKSQQADTLLLGNWKGNLVVSGQSLIIEMKFQKQNDQFIASLSVPQQMLKSLKANQVSFKENKLLVSYSDISSKYEATLKSDSLIGIWEQSGYKLNLNLGKMPFVPESQKIDSSMFGPKTQLVQAPFSYSSKNVVFENTSAKIKLAGTLTLPEGKGPFPAVVLVSGSGPQNRNSEIFGHKPFEVIAHYLSSNGVAVLRYDDRGINDSEGVFGTATTFDFASDAAAAIQFLAKQKRINKKKVGIAGHSEGGIIASILSKEAPRLPDFAILLAGPSLKMDSLLLLQARLVGASEGVSELMLNLQVNTNRAAFAAMQENLPDSILNKRLEEIYTKQLQSLSPQVEGAALDAQLKQIVASLNSPWFKTFIGINPMDYLKDSKMPVLALYGSKDLQVPAPENAAFLEKELSEKVKAGTLKVVTLENLNHLFQTASTGAVSEYKDLKETFSPIALEEMLKFIR